MIAIKLRERLLWCDCWRCGKPLLGNSAENVRNARPLYKVDELPERVFARWRGRPACKRCFLEVPSQSREVSE